MIVGGTRPSMSLGQHLGLVDRAQHGLVPLRHAAALDELAADDGAVGRELHLDRRDRVAGDVVGEDDVRLDARLDAAGIAGRRAGGARRGAGRPPGRRSLPACAMHACRLASRIAAWRASSFLACSASFFFSACSCAAALALGLDPLRLDPPGLSHASLPRACAAPPAAPPRARLSWRRACSRAAFSIAICGIGARSAAAAARA